MIGMPKVFNTKSDYLNCLNIYPEETKVELQRLLDDRFYWKNEGKISKESIPIVDDTHKVMPDDDGDLNQLSFVEDENAKIFRLGFTVEEVTELIGE